MNIAQVNELAEEYLYACMYQHEKAIYGEKLLKALEEVTMVTPVQTDETDEEFVVTLIRGGKFRTARDMLETLLGR